MIRVLVTGFETFGDEPVNPSKELAIKLDGQVLGRAQVYGYVLPVSYNRAKKAVKYILETIDPRIVLSFGLSPQRTVVSIERIALNYAHSRIPDNDGVFLSHARIINEGPIALESTINTQRARDIFIENGIPAIVSYHAGTFLCNYVFYLMLYYSMVSERKAGFIHIPYTHKNIISMLRRNKIKTAPSIDEEKLLHAIRKLIINLVEEERLVSHNSK